jgi:hypothetical protein
MKTTYQIVLAMLLGTLAIPANAQDSKKFATLGDHLPKKGQPTAVQLKFGGDKKVTEDNFIVAESDKYFFEQQSFLFVNAFKHDAKLVTPDSQTVVRQNRDTMYSKGVFDTNGGVTFELPILDTYQSLQVVDEDHKTIAVLYAEKGKNKATITPDMLSFGHHVYVLIRTQVNSMAEEDIQKGREKMRLVIARATESTPYTAKGFDQRSRETVRLEQEKYIPQLDVTKGFGAPTLERLDPFHMRVAASIGWAGFPSEEAFYKVLLAEDRSGACQTMTFEAPPLRDRGFFSMTTYGPDAYIHAYNYAISDRKGELVANRDGSYTVHFNCEGEINNIDVVENWTGILRMYCEVNFTRRGGTRQITSGLRGRFGG